MSRFQCSSASRKFLNAEGTAGLGSDLRFQCSSASRKFLNQRRRPAMARITFGFSALQRAENSSIMRSEDRHRSARQFQCSSASRKVLNFPAQERRCRRRDVSVLFSEPKIPQFRGRYIVDENNLRFSALQRAENSSIDRSADAIRPKIKFQCSSASRKFLNLDPRTCVHPYFRPR